VLTSKLEKLIVTQMKGFDPHQMVAATMVLEGSKDEVEYQYRVVLETAKKFGGISGGAGNGERGYMLTYAIAYIRDLLADYYIVGETYETTVPWSRIHDVCDAVKRVAASEHERLGFPGKPFTSPRVTQMYHTGVCFYFTHGLLHKGIEDGDERFAEVEKNMREAIMAARGFDLPPPRHWQAAPPLRRQGCLPGEPGRRPRPQAGGRPAERFRRPQQHLRRVAEQARSASHTAQLEGMPAGCAVERFLSQGPSTTGAVNLPHIPPGTAARRVP
jgi:hypothetical protein